MPRPQQLRRLFRSCSVSSLPWGPRALPTSINLKVMRQLSRLLLVAVVLSTFGPTLPGTRLQAQTIWDLKTAWSDGANPNGVWTYRGGTTALPYIANWRAEDNWNTTPQEGWAPGNFTGNCLPFWYQSNGTATLPG